MIEQSARELLATDAGYAAQVKELQKCVKLGEAWRAFIEGHASREQAQLILVDLVLETGYFGVAPPDAKGEDLLRREGRRDVMTRIMFLSDMPSSYITKLRRDALDELQKLEG